MDSTEKKQIAFNIFHYDAHLALAFQADCENFLNKFGQLQSFSFGIFAELWRETCFISIFENLDCYSILQTFIENCYFTVKKFLFSDNPYTQIGAIYTLYSLYYKQPIKEWIKIRLTQPEADKLNEIVKIHKENKSWEVVFIYNKLRLDKAFIYCALMQPLGLDAKFIKRFDLSNEDINKKTSHYNPLEKFRNLIEDDPLLKELQDTDREYQNLANKYKEKCKQLFVFPSAIGNELKNALDAVEENFEIENSELENLREIKKRALSNKHAVYRAERKVITGLDNGNKPSCSK